MCNYLVFKTDLSRTLAIDRCYKIQYLYTLNVAAWQQHCVNSVLLPENQTIFVNNFWNYLGLIFVVTGRNRNIVWIYIRIIAC